MKQHTSSTITALLLYCLPIQLVAQHGSGAAGMGVSIGIIIPVLGGIICLAIVLINIIALFNPKKTLNKIGIILSTILLLTILFTSFTVIISGDLDIFLFLILCALIPMLSILHLRRANHKCSTLLSPTDENLLDDHYST